MDPLVLAATEAHKEKKPYRLHGPKTKMQAELEMNPYAQALASPIRQCALTSARLPSHFLQAFTTQLVPPPSEPSKSQSRSAVAEITPDLSADKTGPRTYVLAQAPILDFLAERKRATQVLMPERSKAWMAKNLGRAASGINPQKDVKYDMKAAEKVLDGLREVVRGEAEKGLRHKYVIPLNTIEELRAWQEKEERDWRMEDGRVVCLLSLSDASKETMAELLLLDGSLEGRMGGYHDLARLLGKDEVTLEDFGASWAMMHKGAEWLAILESSRAVEHIYALTRSTGRGFATARMPFGVLYSRFASPSIYFGARLLMMLLFGTLTVWGPWLLWFWISITALCISPFMFNPHQFAWSDFFIDYREFLRWLSRGNTKSHSASWIGYVRLSRTRLTGFKRKTLGEPSSKLSGDTPRAKFTNLFFSEIVGPLVLVAATLLPYLFINAGTGVLLANQESGVKVEATNSLIRIAIIAFGPIAVNAGVAIGFFAMACCMGPLFSMCCKKFGAVLAAIAHAIAVIMMLAFFEVLFFLEGWSFTKTLLGMIAVVAIQRFIFKLIICLALTREFRADTSNIAWWTGKWYSMGWHSMSQPGREFLCKITEMGFFAGDFILGHFILFLMLPCLLVPYIDKFHSVMLFWLRPSRQIRPPIYSLKQSRLRKRRVVRYAIMYFSMFVLFLVLIVGPIIAGKYISFELNVMNLQQPSNWKNNDTLGTSQTGTALAGGGAAATSVGAGANSGLRPRVMFSYNS
ncbi:1,3-beta-D-glucan synthase [Elasticomyces elasticus]